MSGVVKCTIIPVKKVVFLDLEISMVDGKLETNLYIKPSNSQIYLDYHSNHPEHTKSSIPYSQALRVIERCPRQEQLDIHLENLKVKTMMKEGKTFKRKNKKNASNQTECRL